ncbi:hypothetical protein [Paraburkholderia sediminicola]|uniref:hypothetical protein n=1 Tax=Paraburkholderia sediminicola TaxID=458836 RepID=UPI0038BCE31A
MSMSTRNNARIPSSGKSPMALAHGFGGDRRMWRCRARQFAHEYMQRMLPAGARHLIENAGHCPHPGSPGTNAAAMCAYLERMSQ